MSRKKIEAYNQLMEGMDEKAAAHLVKLGIGKSVKENLKNWKARKNRMKAEELKNPFTTVAVRHETRARLDVRSEESLYVTINGWTYYIDDSTNEQIITKWKDGDERKNQD
jgi:hypothetical protein